MCSDSSAVEERVEIIIESNWFILFNIYVFVTRGNCTQNVIQLYPGRTPGTWLAANKNDINDAQLKCERALVFKLGITIEITSQHL
jgi:hypothetical protein